MITLTFGTFDGLFIHSDQEIYLPDAGTFFELRSSRKRSIPAGSSPNIIFKRLESSAGRENPLLVALAYRADEIDARGQRRTGGFMAFGGLLFGDEISTEKITECISFCARRVSSAGNYFSNYTLVSRSPKVVDDTKQLTPIHLQGHINSFVKVRFDIQNLSEVSILGHELCRYVDGFEVVVNPDDGLEAVDLCSEVLGYIDNQIKNRKKADLNYLTDHDAHSVIDDILERSPLIERMYNFLDGRSFLSEEQVENFVIFSDKFLNDPVKQIRKNKLIKFIFASIIVLPVSALLIVIFLFLYRPDGKTDIIADNDAGVLPDTVAGNRPRGEEKSETLITKETKVCDGVLNDRTNLLLVKSYVSIDQECIKISDNFRSQISSKLDANEFAVLLNDYQELFEVPLIDNQIIIFPTYELYRDPNYLQKIKNSYNDGKINLFVRKSDIFPKKMYCSVNFLNKNSEDRPDINLNIQYYSSLEKGHLKSLVNEVAYETNSIIETYFDKMITEIRKRGVDGRFENRLTKIKFDLMQKKSINILVNKVSGSEKPTCYMAFTKSDIEKLHTKEDLIELTTQDFINFIHSEVEFGKIHEELKEKNEPLTFDVLDFPTDIMVQQYDHTVDDSSPLSQIYSFQFAENSNSIISNDEITLKINYHKNGVLEQECPFADSFDAMNLLEEAFCR